MKAASKREQNEVYFDYAEREQARGEASRLNIGGVEGVEGVIASLVLRTGVKANTIAASFANHSA